MRVPQGTKNRINRFFITGSVRRLAFDRTIEQGEWFLRADSRASYAGLERIRIDLTQEGTVVTKKADIKLLKDPEVMKEIERYKWIESEKAGEDIGIIRASREWLAFYADAWRKACSRRKR